MRSKPIYKAIIILPLILIFAAAVGCKGNKKERRMAGAFNKSPCLAGQAMGGNDCVIIEDDCVGDDCEEECVNDNQCAGNKVCEGGRCVEKVMCSATRPCPVGLVCISDVCSPASGSECEGDDECRIGEVCRDERCSAPSGEECESDLECGDGEVCTSGRCNAASRGECDGHDDCDDGEICVDGACHAASRDDCDADDDCRDGEACTEGRCQVASGAGCVEPADCDPGEICSSRRCVAAAGGTCDDDSDCGDGETCRSGVCEEIVRVNIRGEMDYGVRATRRFLAEDEVDRATDEDEETSGDIEDIASGICYPEKYADQRVRIPFVIVFFSEPNFEGYRATFAYDEHYPLVHHGGRDGVKSMKVFKGPNYVEGDKVVFTSQKWEDGRYVINEDWEVGGYFSKRNMMTYEGGRRRFITKIAVRFSAGLSADRCAQERVWRDSSDWSTRGSSLLWGRPIPLRVRVCQEINRRGSCMHLVRSERFGHGVSSEGEYPRPLEFYADIYMLNNIRFILVEKGPDYYERDGGWWKASTFNGNSRLETYSPRFDLYNLTEEDTAIVDRILYSDPSNVMDSCCLPSIELLPSIP